MFGVRGKRASKTPEDVPPWKPRLAGTSKRRWSLRKKEAAKAEHYPIENGESFASLDNRMIELGLLEGDDCRRISPPSDTDAADMDRSQHSMVSRRSSIGDNSILTKPILVTKELSIIQFPEQQDDKNPTIKIHDETHPVEVSCDDVPVEDVPTSSEVQGLNLESTELFLALPEEGVAMAGKAIAANVGQPQDNTQEDATPVKKDDSPPLEKECSPPVEAASKPVSSSEVSGVLPSSTEVADALSNGSRVETPLREIEDTKQTEGIEAPPLDLLAPPKNTSDIGNVVEKSMQTDIQLKAERSPTPVQNNPVSSDPISERPPLPPRRESIEGAEITESKVQGADEDGVDDSNGSSIVHPSAWSSLVKELEASEKRLRLVAAKLPDIPANTSPTRESSDGSVHGKPPLGPGNTNSHVPSSTETATSGGADDAKEQSATQLKDTIPMVSRVSSLGSVLVATLTGSSGNDAKSNDNGTRSNDNGNSKPTKSRHAKHSSFSGVNKQKFGLLGMRSFDTSIAGTTPDKVETDVPLKLLTEKNTTNEACDTDVPKQLEPDLTVKTESATNTETLPEQNHEPSGKDGLELPANKVDEYTKTTVSGTESLRASPIPTTPLVETKHEAATSTDINVAVPTQATDEKKLLSQSEKSSELTQEAEATHKSEKEIPEAVENNTADENLAREEDKEGIQSSTDARNADNRTKKTSIKRSKMRDNLTALVARKSKKEHSEVNESVINSEKSQLKKSETLESQIIGSVTSQGQELDERDESTDANDDSQLPDKYHASSLRYNETALSKESKNGKDKESRSSDRSRSKVLRSVERKSEMVKSKRNKNEDKSKAPKNHGRGKKSLTKSLKVHKLYAETKDRELIEQEREIRYSDNEGQRVKRVSRILQDIESPRATRDTKNSISTTLDKRRKSISIKDGSGEHKAHGRKYDDIETLNQTPSIDYGHSVAYYFVPTCIRDCWNGDGIFDLCCRSSSSSKATPQPEEYIEPETDGWCCQDDGFEPTTDGVVYDVSTRDDSLIENDEPVATSTGSKPNEVLNSKDSGTESLIDKCDTEIDDQLGELDDSILESQSEDILYVIKDSVCGVAQCKY